MIPEYINYWIRIIDTMSNQNTYKLAWGRALLEKLNSIEVQDDDIVINVDSLSEIVIKYYWNQIFFFNLKQSPNDSVANIIDIIKELIEFYKKKTNSNIPKWFLDGYNELKNEKIYLKSINKITTLLMNNPGTYFPNASIDGKNRKERLPIYEMDKGNKNVIFKCDDAKSLKEYNLILAKMLNFKWAQLLENYNYVPKVSEKITSISNEKVDRSSLKEYCKALIESSPDGLPHDFYDNNEVIPNGEISVDHVIPWSFIYSDDIWNLVLTTKSNNSSKSNNIPSDEAINRLKIRNALLVDTIKNEKYKKALEYSIECNLIDRLYYELKVAA